MRRMPLRSRNARVVLGVTVGGAVGLTIFYASQIHGPPLYILTGAVAGGVAAIVVHGYSRNAHLSEVTLTVPQLSELRFVVTRDAKRVAWKLFVESITRVSTQPLDDGSGRLREAMTSLYALFDVVRETLKQTLPSVAEGNAPTVEQLAITMLNLELRPFLARWHPALRRWEEANPGTDESGWPENATCRAELAQVQARIRDYALGYARLAGLENAATFVVAPPMS